MKTEQYLLIEYSKQGDTGAFARLYSDYADEMYRYSVYMMGNKQDAEDVMQDAILSAWRNIHTLRDDSVEVNVFLECLLVVECSGIQDSGVQRFEQRTDVEVLKHFLLAVVKNRDCVADCSQVELKHLCLLSEVQRV